MNPGVVLVDLLGGLVNQEVHASTFPQVDGAPVRPAIRFTVVSSDNFPDQCPDDPDTDDVRVQLDIVADTYDAMRALKDAVILAMKDSDPPARRQPGNFETYDTETRTHRASVDYVFHPSSSQDSPP